MAARACSAADLKIDYYGGGAGTGNDFGLIRVRDVSASACTFAGPVGLVGATRSGTPDTDHLTYHVAKPLTLTPRTRRIEPGHLLPAGTTVASIELAAAYRDDPTSPNGLCEAHRVIPARWQIKLPNGTMSVANTSTGSAYKEFSSLLTCSGELDTPELINSR